MFCFCCIPFRCVRMIVFGVCCIFLVIILEIVEWICNQCVAITSVITLDMRGRLCYVFVAFSCLLVYMCVVGCAQCLLHFVGNYFRCTRRDMLCCCIPLIIW